MFSTFALRNERGGSFLTGWLGVERWEGGLFMDRRPDRNDRKKGRKNKKLFILF
jgi:hypothetical protein